MRERLRQIVTDASAAMAHLEEDERTCGAAGAARWVEVRESLQPLLPEEEGGVVAEFVLENYLLELATDVFLGALLRIAAHQPEPPARRSHADARAVRNARVVAQKVRNRVVDLVMRAEEMTSLLHCHPSAVEGPPRALSPTCKIK